MNDGRCSGPCFNGLKDGEWTFRYCIDCPKRLAPACFNFSDKKRVEAGDS